MAAHTMNIRVEGDVCVAENVWMDGWFVECIEMNGVVYRWDDNMCGSERSDAV